MEGAVGEDGWGSAGALCTGWAVTFLAASSCGIVRGWPPDPRLPGAPEAANGGEEVTSLEAGRCR